MSQSRPGDIFRPGDLLNNTYRVEAVLGRGGISEVYRARSEISGRVVAVKALNREFARNEAFLVLMTREEEIRDIRHDAIVRYSECQRTPDGHVYLVMDFVDGVGLDARLRDGGMPMRDLLTVGERVAAGLEAAHDRHIVHRDLSPDNIILRSGDPAQAVIIDFGIAKDATPGAATIVGGKFAGKYAYAAPEQFRGNTDPRSDIYSLGALLLSTFRGAEPDVSEFPADVIEYKKAPLDTEGVPQPLRGLLDRMVVPDPAARFQTAAEMRAAFAKAIDSLTVIQAPAGDVPEAEAVPGRAAGETSGRRRRPILLTLLSLLVISGAVGYYAWDRGYFYPVVDKFVLTARDSRGTAPVVEGNVPSPEVLDQLSDLVEGEQGTHSLTLSRSAGTLHPDWGVTVGKLLRIALDLDTFDLHVEDHDIVLTGESNDPVHRDEILARLAAASLPDGFDLKTDITLPPGYLFPEDLAPVLADAATCGPLNTPGLTEAGLPPGAPLRVTGAVEDLSARLALRDAVAAAAGERSVDLGLQEMNTSVCTLLAHVPDVPESAARIEYRFGRTGQPNPAGRYFPGENPVIDIVLPPDMTDGYLYVMLVDANGDAARLLPNPFRPEHDLRTLRAGADGEVPVRIAYSFDEARGSQRLTLRIDDSAPGKGMILLLHTDAQIVPAPARRDETVTALAAALDAAARSEAGQILSARTRVLETATN